MPSGDNSQLFLALSAVLGGASGWGTGIELSPYTRSDCTSFKGIGKAISAFIGGYLTGKLDPLSLLSAERSP
jgi:hypothetical protein